MYFQFLAYKTECASGDLNPGPELGKLMSYQARLLAHAKLFEELVYLTYPKMPPRPSVALDSSSFILPITSPFSLSSATAAMPLDSSTAFLH